MHDTDFQTVREALRPEDVFTDHEWKTQGRQWKGTCPWHDSKSGTCFSLNPETLEWKCFSCGRGGGPLEYVAELEGISGPLEGKAFMDAWNALSDHAGCPGPPDGTRQTTGHKRSERDPLKALARRPKRGPLKAPAEHVEAPLPPETGSASVDREPGYSEADLRAVLLRYRTALKGSDHARAYVQSRGLSVDTLYTFGCGYAAPGEWPQDTGRNASKHRAPAGRIVTPHTTPSGHLVNLYGREASADTPSWRKHRHLGGPKALFNAKAIRDGSGPLVLCESSLDALSFIEVGHARTVAVHGKHGLPWATLRDAVETLVIALDDDAQDDARKIAREAVLRGYEAHILPADAYSGHGDPNEALHAGCLDVSYVTGLHDRADTRETDTCETDARAPEEEDDEAPETNAHTPEDARQTDAQPDGGQSPAVPPEARIRARERPEDWRVASPEDLVPYWRDRPAIGALGEWLWTFPGEIPEGPVHCEQGFHVDFALLKWIVWTLETGPGADPEDVERLETILWRLYIAFSDEGHGPPPKPGAHVEAPLKGEWGTRGTVRESYLDKRRMCFRVAIEAKGAAAHAPDAVQYVDRRDVESAEE